VLIGGEYCIYILINTAPDRTITKAKALQGLTALWNKLSKIQE
jgi:hypothetical protein